MLHSGHAGFSAGGMQTGLVVTGRYTVIRDWPIFTSPLRWQNTATNFRSAWWRSWILKRDFPCGIPDPRWKCTCSLPHHSLCLTCLLFTHPSSPPIHSQALRMSPPSSRLGSYITMMPQGFHFSSGTFYRCSFYFWQSVMIEDHQKLRSGTFIV